MPKILKPLELAYRGVNRVRRGLYQKSLLQQKRLPRPVISVGNIAMGGSGKTPTVIAIARHFAGLNKRVVVLSRGYGRAAADSYAVVDSADATRFGDEPVLLARSLPSADIVVGADRFLAAFTYLLEHECDLFILDDGFQHLQLARDCDVVLDLRSARWLREGRQALEYADAVVARQENRREITSVGLRSPSQFEAVLQPVDWIHQGEVMPLVSMRGVRVIAFAGLADNVQFFDTVTALGAAIVNTREFPDHHRYSTIEIRALKDAARDASAILLTSAKDSVKLHDDGIAVLNVEMHIAPADLFFQLLELRVAEAAARLKVD